MARLENHANLFGLDLSGLGAALLEAWQGIGSWPVFAWLRPKAPVCVVLPDGQTALYFKEKYVAKATEKDKLAAKYTAIQLPEEALLRRVVSMPELGVDETQAALALEAHTHSPFLPDQTIWAAFPRASSGLNTRAFELVLTSRSLVQSHSDHLKTTLLKGNRHSYPLEVWVTSAAGTLMALPGYGEGVRLSRLRNGFRLNVFLLLTALLLSLSVLLAPMVQLRMRALDASSQHVVLQQRVAPILQQRESYAALHDKWQSLSELSAQGFSAVQVLHVVTQILPADTSVLTFQAQVDQAAKAVKVQITGQTQNAAALMQQMGQQTGIRDVKAPTPAVKPPGAIKESYSIDFLVDAVKPVVAP